jgi:hypothetical protein
MTHEVTVLHSCHDIEQCRMEVYVADVRIAQAEIARLRFERDCLSGYVEGLLGHGVPVEDYMAQRGLG